MTQQSAMRRRRVRRVTLGLGAAVLTVVVLVAAQGDFREELDVSRPVEDTEPVDVTRSATDAGQVDVSQFAADPAAAEEREAARAARRAAAFRQRLASARSLLDAYARTIEEQSLGQEARTSVAAIRATLDRAEGQFAGGDRDAGLELLDEASLRVKMSLQAALDGTTQYLALNFDSPEEEYRYEQSRHDTHRQLAQHYLAERVVSESAREQVLDALAASDGLRGTAREEAARGEYDAAIASLETATRKLIRALRSVGIFIPG